MPMDVGSALRRVAVCQPAHPRNAGDQTRTLQREVQPYLLVDYTCSIGCNNFLRWMLNPVQVANGMYVYVCAQVGLTPQSNTNNRWEGWATFGIFVTNMRHSVVVLSASGTSTRSPVFMHARGRLSPKLERCKQTASPTVL